MNYKSVIKINILIFFVGVFFCKTITAQKLSWFSNYPNNHIYNINPAAAGFDGSFISQLTFSKKWMGVDGSPTCQIFSNSLRLGDENFYNENMFINRPIINIADRIGVGLTIFNETNGPLKHTGFLFAYAYHIPFRENRLSLGLSGTLTQYNLNTQLFKPIDVDDPELNTDNKALIPDVNFGIMFHNPRFNAGLSINNIVNLNNTMDHSNTFPTIVAHGGCIFRINSIYKVEPELYFWKFQGENLIADLNCKFVFKNRSWILLSYQNYNSLLAGICLSINKAVQISYSYTLGTQGLSAYYSGNQTLSIRADIAALISKY